MSADTMIGGSVEIPFVRQKFIKKQPVDESCLPNSLSVLDCREQMRQVAQAEMGE
jgi:hypothetical protein